jgi:hypothetical protein
MPVIDLEEIREKMSAYYMDLTMRYGLSDLEAVCFCLVRIMGIPPVQASDVILELFGRRVSNASVSTYVNRAQKKLDIINLQLDYDRWLRKPTL